MKSLLILQIEDRKTELLTTLLQHNKKACEKNNVEYIFLEKSSFHIPPYWQKVYEIDKYMSEYPDIDYFMWLDSDAFLANFSREKMQNFFDKHSDYSAIISKDMPPWDGEFNAGSFIIKNDESGRKIIKDWIGKYKSENWTFENPKWTTQSTWAGEDYEQGAFSNHILKDPSHRQNIIQLPFWWLNNNSCDENKESISVHLAGHYKDDKDLVENCMKNFISLKEGFSSNDSTLYQFVLALFAVLLIVALILIFVRYKSTKKRIINFIRRHFGDRS